MAKIPSKLFHISQSGRNLHSTRKYYPRIPENRMDDEDSTTPRVCFSTSIPGCIRAIEQDIHTDDIFFVLSPVENTKELSLHKPTVKEVPDVKITREWWCLEDVELKCIGEIQITRKLYGEIKWRWNERFDTAENRCSGITKNMV